MCFSLLINTSLKLSTPRLPDVSLILIPSKTFGTSLFGVYSWSLSGSPTRETYTALGKKNDFWVPTIAPKCWPQISPLNIQIEKYGCLFSAQWACGSVYFTCSDITSTSVNWQVFSKNYSTILLFSFVSFWSGGAGIISKDFTFKPEQFQSTISVK